MYRVELLIQDDMTEQDQADCLLEVGDAIEVGDESGATVQGRIITVTIRKEDV